MACLRLLMAMIEARKKAINDVMDAIEKANVGNCSVLVVFDDGSTFTGTVCPVTKGGMCASCERLHEDCSMQPFEAMPVIKVEPDGTRIVRCTQHVRRGRD